MPSPTPSPLVFGEVLFDEFPDGRRVLGGAPFNVAWNLAAFGLAPRMISRHGNDAEGQQVRQAMSGWGMSTGLLQIDPQLPTGRVRVTLEDGEPGYEICQPAAWDAIEPVEINDSGLLYHGSLALRNAVSATVLEHLRHQASGPVFMDVNLRPPWFQREQVMAAMERANWVKLNAQESSELGFDQQDFRRRTADIVQRFSLDGVIVTRGGDGAVAATASGDFLEARSHSRAQIKSAVGAGDALASVMILGLLRSWPLQQSLERAVAFAAAVCTLLGATTRDRAFYQAHINDWNSNDAR